MSKQKTLFQSWGGQNSKTCNEQPTLSTSKNTKNNAIINLCDSLDDGEDDLLCEAEFSTHAFQDGQENQSNISIGADGFAPTQGPSQNTTCPGFDMSAGKLWIYPTNYPVRDYQFNIVSQSLFKNTMVTLPTGLGKTFIAAVVMYNFYRWYPQGKIIFMAPTKPLVAQQIEACYNIMGIPQEHTAEMTGSMGPPKREKCWHDKRVFFLTPQVLTNDLSRGSCPAHFVKCLVIDEAHKALGNHAYCQVVRELVKYTEEFRVLALSATPGSDIKAVQQVLSNLLISHIEIRTEESIDIKQYSHERIVDKVVVPLGEELTKIKDKYVHIMEMIVNKLKRQGVLYNRDTTSMSKFLILKAREAFRQNPPEQLQRAQYGIVEGDFALAMSVYHGYELLQLHGSRSLYNFLEGILTGDKGYGRTRTELGRNGDFINLMEELREKYSVPPAETPSQSLSKPFVIGHPKMEKLQEIVLEHFRKFEAKNAATRVMIFSQYRDSVQEIKDMLNVHRPLVKVMSFIGQSSAGKSTKGFTQKEQLIVMREFREGGYNTLVSTCVGEEGLDIGDVDLIICFDAHKSPIRLVQRMGRTGRKREGRIVMLVTKGKEEQIYNQSQYSKRSIHRAILDGARSLHFYQQSPRMVPETVSPSAHKMHITVTDNFKPTKKLSADTTIASLFNKEKQDVSDGLITREEYEELKPWLVPEDEVPKLPNSDVICLATDDAEDSIVARGHLLSLSEWTPWQNTLQPTSDLMGHSRQSKNLVELMEFVQLQSHLDPGEDPYGLEMAQYLNEDDILKPGDKTRSSDSITKYCVRRSNEDESTAAIAPTERNWRHKYIKSKARDSNMLPEIDADKTDTEEESEDELPAFCLNGKTQRLCSNENIEHLPDANEGVDYISTLETCYDIPIHLADENKELLRDEGLNIVQPQEDLVRKVGKICQKKVGKSNSLFKSKAKALDLKMKSNLNTGKRKKGRTMNRSVIELLRSTDENDFDRTPPDSNKAKPDFAQTDQISGDMCMENNDCTEGVIEKERQYVIRTPPTVEDAIRLCEAAELEADRVKIDLLELIDEWHRENQNGKYIVFGDNEHKISANGSLKKSDKKTKVSESIDKIQLNTSTVVSEGNVCDDGYENVSFSRKAPTFDEPYITPKDTGNSHNKAKISYARKKQTCINRSAQKETEKCYSNNKHTTNIDTNTDVEMSGTFQLMDQNDIENITDRLNNSPDLGYDLDTEKGGDQLNKIASKSYTSNHIHEKGPCSFDNDDTVSRSLLTKVDTNQSLSTTKRSSLAKRSSIIASGWVSEDSDDDKLYGNIKTQKESTIREVSSLAVRNNVSTQLTYTQAMSCVHSGSMTSDSDSCSDGIHVHGKTDKLLLSADGSSSIHKIDSHVFDTSKHSSTSENLTPDTKESRKDFFRNNSKQNISQSSLSTEPRQKGDLSKNMTRRASTSSDELEQVDFDLGFDIDEDIIPPSPEMSQPFQVSGRGRLSQTFTSRLSQSRFVACDGNNTDLTGTTDALHGNDTLKPKSKRFLKLEDKPLIETKTLDTLEEEEESQSILEDDTVLKETKVFGRNAPSPSKKISRLNELQSNSQRMPKYLGNSPHNETLLKKKKGDKLKDNIEEREENEQNEDAFESSFALFDDDFDEWIDGDIDKITNNGLSVEKSPAFKSQVQLERNKKSEPYKANNNYADDANLLKQNSSKNTKEKKKMISQNRKSLFCPADLSLEDSFDLDNVSHNFSNKQINSCNYTPNAIKSKTLVIKNTSTPVVGQNVVTAKFDSPAVTPVDVKKMKKLSADLDQSDVDNKTSSTLSSNDDSFVVRRKKRKPVCIESPKSQLDIDSPVVKSKKTLAKNRSVNSTILSESTSSNKETSWDEIDDWDDSILMKNNDYFGNKNNLVQIHSNSDNDDFHDDSIIRNTSGEKGKHIREHNAHTSKSKKMVDKKDKKSKAKRPSNPFLEVEAELSDEDDMDASSDESDASHLDRYEGSFIQDSQFSQSQGLNHTDIQALYLKSVKSPVGVNRGGFKLQYDYKHVDVFSQMPQEEDESQYMEDSFCVGSEDDDWLAEEDFHGEITMANNQSAILQSGKKRRRGVSNLQTGRQRAIHFGRMKALDEIRAKKSKKNTQAIGDYTQSKTGYKAIQNENKGLSKKSKLKILEEYSSDEEVVNVPAKQTIVSPELQGHKKRKRVRLLSSSDDELQDSKVVCTQQRSYTGNTPWKVSIKQDNQTNQTSYTENEHVTDCVHLEISSDECDAKIKVPNNGEDKQITSKDLTKEQRLHRQREKQEEYRKKMTDNIDNKITVDKIDNSEKSCSMTKIKDKSLDQDESIEKPFQKNYTNLLIHSKISNCDTLCILVDSREISGAQDVISDLRFKHKIQVSAAQLPGCDYIVSNRMAVERKQWSDFSNGANRSKLIERIQHLGELYDRACLIVEKDRVKPGEEKSERPQHWTKYIDRTCAMLLKSQVKILFTDTQAETASNLAELAQLEKRKGLHISAPVSLNTRKTELVKFYASFPKLSYVHALNLCEGFESVTDFLKSSQVKIEQKGKMSRNRAIEVFNFIQRTFDTSMLPTKHK